MIIGILCFLAGLMFGVAVTAVTAAGNTTNNTERLDANLRVLWGSVNRLGDENDALRARIYDIEQKLEAGKDGKQHD